MQRWAWTIAAIVLAAPCMAAAPAALPMANEVQADRLVELSRRWAAPLPRTPRLADLQAVIPVPAALIEKPGAPPQLTLPAMPFSPPLRVIAGVVTLHTDHQRVQSVRLDIGGACVTRQQINHRLGRPDRVLPPSGHAPEQALTLSYAEADRWMSYLFPGVDHRCVSQVIIKPVDAPAP
ncbi:hypothetical protein [Stenotrophomonas forensis]|uniref:hypothetical protein n=1 Tax=Stenotrophomonas forensis TaxID=2871169 RepID=UPI0039C63A69